MKIQNAKNILRKFIVLVEVTPMNGKIIHLSLASDFKDFEDAIKYHTAVKNELQIILSKNSMDLKKSKIPVLTTKNYLALIK